MPDQLLRHFATEPNLVDFRKVEFRLAGEAPAIYNEI